jgi:signal recognition particle subunit SRP54
LVAADVRRPAAAGQLKILGEKAGVETFSGKGNSALTIAADALNYAGTRGINLLIVDTAGRLHIDQELMEELKELKSFLQPRDVLLVLDAMTGQDAVRVAVEFDRQAGIDGAILTKLDGDARGGSAISFRAVTGKPIKLIGVGEKIEDLQVFDPSRAVSRILGMGDVVSLVEKAQQVIDRDESEKLEKAGGVESMLETLPVGMTGLEDGTFQLKRVGAILDSMTPEERKTPPIIDGSRRVRIARGSGTSVAEVNRVLKQFNLFNKMAGKMGQIDKKKLSLGGVPWQFGSD